MQIIDTEFKKEIQGCYKTLHSFFEPILSVESVLHLIQHYKNQLPNHYKIMKYMLQFDKKENKTENEHLLQQVYYDKRIFTNSYHFLGQRTVIIAHIGL